MTVLTHKARKPKLLVTAKPGSKPGVKTLANNAPAATPAVSKTSRSGSRVADVRGQYAAKPTKKRSGRAAVATPLSPLPAQDVVREPTTLFDRMGRLLDQSLRSESDIVRMVDAGLPASAFTHLTRSLSIGHELIAPESTIRRRVQDNQRFTTDESERMVRIARVHALAAELFGDETAAQAWLNAPAVYVPDAIAVTPYKLSVTDAGARLVEDMLLRTAHGVF
jgi:putative toxin-antitoxin system antitoxin component (TIGR02293 family)